MKIIKRLLELLKAGTQEPWELIAGEHSVTVRVGTAYVGAPYQKPHGRGACPVQLADGSLMVEGRNALPALLAVVEAQAAEIAAWKDFNAVGGKINELILLNATMDTHKALAALRALEGGE